MTLYDRDRSKRPSAGRYRRHQVCHRRRACLARLRPTQDHPVEHQDCIRRTQSCMGGVLRRIHPRDTRVPQLMGT